MEFTVTREYIEVFQGSPRTRIANYVTDENYNLSIQGIEWNLMTLPLALGAGVTSSSVSQDTFAFGGDPDTQEVAGMVIHTMPTGQTITFHFYRMQADGEWQLNLKAGELQQFPYSFAGLAVTRGWDGTALASGAQLFKIIRTKQ